MAKRLVWADQAKVDIRAIDRERPYRCSRRSLDSSRPAKATLNSFAGYDPPLFRLRAQDYRVFFQDKGEHIEIIRVLDRKEAYR